MKSFHWLCVSVLFSSCGDRAWNFVVGTYLIRLTPGSLQLAAIYGLLLTGSTILFSPVVGNWIDRNKRLKVVRLLLILQNIFFISSAVLILVCLHSNIAHSSPLMKVLQGAIVVMSAVSNLAGQGEKISVTKDWFVVVCHNNNDELAKANALRRLLDLLVAVLAPFAVGALLDAIPDVGGITFICLWNAGTKFIEYRILLHVYRKDPDLSQKQRKNSGSVAQVECTNYAKDESNVVMINNKAIEQDATKQYDLDQKENTQSMGNDDTTTNHKNDTESSENSQIDENHKENILDRLKVAVYGWKIYYQQKVALAGLALALLYSTVLDFNAITTAYAVSVGFKKMYISICFGMGSLCGVFGSFLFPFLRRCLGLPKTGIFGGLTQLCFLSLCVLSIWLPGSPSGISHHVHQQNNTSGELHDITNLKDSVLVHHGIRGEFYSGNLTTQIPITRSNSSTTEPPVVESGDGNIAIWFLFVGIILSRTGLWIADITVTQLQQEYVPVEERGVVGGVQNALNSTFDLIHYIITVALPYPHEFWILIFISVAAVGSSFVTYIVFNVMIHRTGVLKKTNEIKT